MVDENEDDMRYEEYNVLTTISIKERIAKLTDVAPSSVNCERNEKHFEILRIFFSLMCKANLIQISDLFQFEMF